ncbi:UNVERIFIED_ORG: hypothetical protein ABIB13_000364 [Arthrobacter sp. UYEF2]
MRDYAKVPRTASADRSVWGLAQIVNVEGSERVRFHLGR